MFAHALVSVLVCQNTLGYQKAAGVENVLQPKLSLTEESAARRLELKTWIIDEYMFLKPRMMTLEIPGKGSKLIWYLIYRMTNRSSEPRNLVPDFILVDSNGKSYNDQIIPKAQRAIQAKEYPLQPLHNSITIVGPIEPSVDEGVDNSKYGVAIWTDIDPTLNSFTIYCVGMSNAYRKIEDAVTGKTLVQRKTLQLKFSRPGDQFLQNDREIKFLGHDWIYR